MHAHACTEMQIRGQNSADAMTCDFSADANVAAGGGMLARRNTTMPPRHHTSWGTSRAKPASARSPTPWQNVHRDYRFGSGLSHTPRNRATNYTRRDATCMARMQVPCFEYWLRSISPCFNELTFARASGKVHTIYPANVCFRKGNRSKCNNKHTQYVQNKNWFMSTLFWYVLMLYFGVW